MNGEMNVAPRLGRQMSLGRREAEGHVYADVLAPQRTASYEPRLGEWHLDHDVVVDLGQTSALIHHSFRIQRNDLRAHRTVHGLTDLQEEIGRLTVAGRHGHEGRVRGHSVDEACFGGSSDLVGIGGVEENSHVLFGSGRRGVGVRGFRRIRHMM